MTQPTITSLQNERVKAATKLREHRGRVRQGRIIIDGLREIAQAQQAGVLLSELFHLPEPTAPQALEILAKARAAGVPCLPVAPAVMEKLAFGQRLESVLATAAAPSLSLEAFAARALAGPAPLLCVVEGVEKPGNLGAILRTADGAGASGVLVADGGTDLYNPNVIRASLGAVFSLPVVALAAAAARVWLAEAGVAVYAAVVGARQTYWEADLSGPTAVVLGSEAYGLSEVWCDPEVRPIALPMRGRVDSLNVASTAAILLYEAQRQRQRLK